ncbi:hypothetical protein, partial [Corynebacterium sp. HMSC035E02]|uniref:hypothetical protein n=1 Tax=Corynebacterium sp. HMSC035E02 TaxID=1715114 RepID=UPI001AEF5095
VSTICGQPQYALIISSTKNPPPPKQATQLCRLRTLIPGPFAGYSILEPRRIAQVMGLPRREQQK